MHKNLNRVNITHQAEVILLNKKRKSMLEIIFKAREEKLASLTNDDKFFFKKHNIDISKRRDKLNAELEKIPKEFRQIETNIAVQLDYYIETINRGNWYLCKKYYLAGFIDGIKLSEEIK